MTKVNETYDSIVRHSIQLENDTDRQYEDICQILREKRDKLITLEKKVKYIHDELGLTKENTELYEKLADALSVKSLKSKVIGQYSLGITYRQNTDGQISYHFAVRHIPKCEEDNVDDYYTTPIAVGFINDYALNCVLGCSIHQFAKDFIELLEREYTIHIESERAMEPPQPHTAESTAFDRLFAKCIKSYISNDEAN